MLFLHKKEFDFAVRICAYLAGNTDKSPIPVSSLSKKLLITKPFATKIIYNLRQSDIVNSIQGKNGGIYLNKDPKSLSLFDILGAMGLKKTISECITEKDFCPLPAPCKVHSYFMKVENDILNDLKKKKILNFSFNDSDIKSISN